MPLFGGARDISLFKTMNKELINDIIQTEIGYYKFVLQETEVNVYGESDRKIYYEPLLIPCLIDKEAACLLCLSIETSLIAMYFLILFLVVTDISSGEILTVFAFVKFFIKNFLENLFIKNP